MPGGPSAGDGWGGVCFCSTWAQAPSLSQVHSSPGEVVLVKAERGLMYRGPSIHPTPWVLQPPTRTPSCRVDSRLLLTQGPFRCSHSTPVLESH